MLYIKRNKPCKHERHFKWVNIVITRKQKKLVLNYSHLKTISCSIIIIFLKKKKNIQQRTKILAHEFNWIYFVRVHKQLHARIVHGPNGIEFPFNLLQKNAQTQTHSRHSNLHMYTMFLVCYLKENPCLFSSLCSSFCYMHSLLLALYICRKRFFLLFNCLAAQIETIAVHCYFVYRRAKIGREREAESEKEKEEKKKRKIGNMTKWMACFFFSSQYTNCYATHDYIGFGTFIVECINVPWLLLFHFSFFYSVIPPIRVVYANQDFWRERDFNSRWQEWDECEWTRKKGEKN